MNVARVYANEFQCHYDKRYVSNDAKYYAFCFQFRSSTSDPSQSRIEGIQNLQAHIARGDVTLYDFQSLVVVPFIQLAKAV